MSDPVLLTPPTPPVEDHDPSPADVVAHLTPMPRLAVPSRVSRIDFSRLFTLEEKIALNAVRAQVAALPANAYLDAVQYGALLAAEVVLQSFELPLEHIELDHPDTAAGLGVLGMVGVFGANAAARIAAILAGRPPA